MLGLTLTTRNASPAISTADAKAHLRVSHTSEDDRIAVLVATAEDRVSETAGVRPVSSVYTLSTDRFPTGSGWITLPRAPLASVTSVSYLDENGDSQTLATTVYRTVDGKPARIGLKVDQDWPTVAPVIGAVTVVFSAGYANAAAVPKAIRQAMLLMIGAWYERREEIVTGTIVATLPEPLSARALLWPHRISLV